jgi:hypothetical protein
MLKYEPNIEEEIGFMVTVRVYFNKALLKVQDLGTKHL